MGRPRGLPAGGARGWRARPEVDDMTEADLGYADTVYEQVPCMIDGAARICIALKAAMERIETCRG